MASTSEVPTGRDQLAAWIERRFPNSPRPQREAVDLLGIDEFFLSKILNGSRRPGLTNAVKIEERTGIPVKAWMSTELDTSESETSSPVRKQRKTK